MFLLFSSKFVANVLLPDIRKMVKRNKKGGLVAC